MSQPKPKYASAADWDTAYRQGTPPWDAGRPHAELARVLDEYRLRPRTVLEVGCGTGADAIVLARRRFEVTAVDYSPIAIERARLRAEQSDALLRLVLDDVFVFARTAGQFDLVYDAGMYHSIRRTNLEEYLDMLWRVTRPGSHYFCLAGAPAEEVDGNGPGQVSEDEIHNELGRLFEFVHLRPTRLESADPKQSYAGWSCLMLRPPVGKQ
ncbi:MAG: class I SAM-dependent methyltransferase [Thermoguttaceae bacterium]|jgi:SAM-dependent methyltransferase